MRRIHSARHFLGGGALILILLLGAYLRLSNLGGPDFGIDEILHIYAAEKLIAGEPPTLPSGINYSRAWPFTRTVALIGEFVGLTEATARIPSVVFGCLAIAIVFVMTWRWYSAGAGLVAAFIMALAPMDIAYSRQVRFYTMFQCIYLLLVYSVFQGLHSAAPRRERTERALGRMASLCGEFQLGPTFLVSAAALFWLAMELQHLILVAVMGPVAYVLCMAFLADVTQQLPRTERLKWRIGGGVTVALGLLAATYLYVSGEYRGYIGVAQFAPNWAQGSVSNWRFYFDGLVARYGLIFAGSVLALLISLAINARATFYLALCFAVPVLIQSVFTAWKSPRYIFHLTPLLFVICGSGVAVMSRGVYERVASWMPQIKWIGVSSQSVASTLVAASLVFVVIASPELRAGFRTHRIEQGQFAAVQHNNWKNALTFVEANSQAGQVIVTSCVLLAKYYGPQLPLYRLNNSEVKDREGETVLNPDETHVEFSVGAPIIADVRRLRQVVEQHPSGWFVTERLRFSSPVSIPSDIALFIEERFQQQDVPGAEDMMVWRWGH